MPQPNDWAPFRPSAADLKATAQDVAEIPAIQQEILDKCKDLCCPDRVAHQYQIAGGKVILKIASDLPAPLQGIGLFQPGAEYTGIGRISTGLGTPHIETNPDFLGLRLAFQTRDRARVDFLAINDPKAPTDNHRDFMNLLHATGDSAGARVPLIGEWGDYQAPDLAAQQTEFAIALQHRMGLVKALKTLAHLTGQTMRTFLSSTAYQQYWTGVEELGGNGCKFTMAPLRNENHPPGFRPGQHYLSEEWQRRQAAGDIEFHLYWIPFLDHERTPLGELTKGWQEDHRQLAGTVRFPQADPGSEEAHLWAILANEMGANPGNWVHDGANSIAEPATQFGVARKIAYQLSQKGRDALDPALYQSVFENAGISAELAEELRRRRDRKMHSGHVSAAGA